MNKKQLIGALAVGTTFCICAALVQDKGFEAGCLSVGAIIILCSVVVYCREHPPFFANRNDYAPETHHTDETSSLSYQFDQGSALFDRSLTRYNQTVESLEKVQEALQEIFHHIDCQLNDQNKKALNYATYDLSGMIEDNRVFMQEMKERYLEAMSQHETLGRHCVDKLSTIEKQERHMIQSALAWDTQYRPTLEQHNLSRSEYWNRFSSKRSFAL